MRPSRHHSISTKFHPAHAIWQFWYELCLINLRIPKFGKNTNGNFKEILLENASYVALSRQTLIRRKLSITAHNLANVNTPSYKAEKLLFRQFLVQPKNTGQLSYVQDHRTLRDETIGSISFTNNPLDVAIDGQGFFQVETPLGTRYTRNGAFKLDNNNMLVTSEGHRVQGNAGDIIIPQGTQKISIADDGQISADDIGIGSFQIYDFEAREDLRKMANGLYITDQEPIDVPQKSLQQGALENSNVKAVMEMSDMISIHREYTSVSNFIRSEDERMKKVIRQMTSRS